MKIVILSLDSLGDLVLREPMVHALLDHGHEVTMVLRKEIEVLSPFWEKRAKMLTADILPNSLPGRDTWEKASLLLNQIMDLKPDLLVAANYNRTYLDDWVL